MNPDELVQGKTYSISGFLHTKYPIPKIQSVVYLGKNLFSKQEESKKDEYIFQEPKYYYINDMRQALTDEEFNEFYDPEYSGKLIVSEESLHTICDINEIISWLSSLRNNKSADEIF